MVFIRDGVYLCGDAGATSVATTFIVTDTSAVPINSDHPSLYCVVQLYPFNYRQPCATSVFLSGFAGALLLPTQVGRNIDHVNQLGPL